MPPGGRLTTTPMDAAGPGETVLGSETTGGSVPAVNWSVSVPAVLSCRLLKDTIPPCTVALIRADQRPGAAGQRRGDHRAVIARLEVAVLVLLIHDRLGAERLSGGRRRRGLSVDDQLAGRRRVDRLLLVGRGVEGGVGGGDRRRTGLDVGVVEGGGALAGRDRDAGDRVAGGVVEGAGRAGRAQLDRLRDGGCDRVAVGVLELHGDRPAVDPRDQGQRVANDRHLIGDCLDDGHDRRRRELASHVVSRQRTVRPRNRR